MLVFVNNGIFGKVFRFVDLWLLNVEHRVCRNRCDDSVTERLEDADG